MDMETETNNFKARPYQDQFVEIILNKNSIVYLPTGAGKTFIAVLAIKHFAKDLALSLAAGGKRSVFLVNTVCLAKQQKDFIESLTSFKTAVYTGDLNVDNWKKEKWREEFEKNQVIVATCQIVLDIVRSGYLSISDFNVIVYDECHHAQKDHPMKQLMSHFKDIPLEKQPRVIGLTGMLVAGQVKPHNVVQLIDDLEKTFRATVTTAQNFNDYKNILIYSTNPEEYITQYNNPQEVHILKMVNAIVQNLQQKIDIWRIDNIKTVFTDREFATKNPKKAISNLFKDFSYQVNDFGVYGASIAILSVLVELELKKRSAETASLRALARICITTAELIRHKLVRAMDNNDDDNDDGDNEDDNTTKEPEANKIMLNSSPKLNALLRSLITLIKKYDSKDFKCLVFVQRRYTAKCLYHVLKRFSLDNPHFPIAVDFMVGANNSMPESIEAILEQKWNREILNKFRKGETNLIVASSVLEEGVDLQMCNVVIHYDVPLNFRSYIQRKGRARKSTSSNIIMLLATDTVKFHNKLNEYHLVDKILKDYLIGKSIDRQMPDENEINRELEKQLIPPFKTKKGATLESLSAISLLNRYCTMLPNDQFTNSSVQWTKENINDKIIVNIRLPLQSTVRDEIQGDPMPSLKVAKRSAAFKVCKLLYENGELSENLLPISRTKKMEDVKEIYFKHWDKYSNDDRKIAGTKKQKRTHNICYPPQTFSCQPKPGIRCYLYIIRTQASLNVKPKGYIDDDLVIFKQLYNDKNNYGILTTKLLPKLAVMRFFVTAGEVDAHIAPKPIKMMLKNDEDFEILKNFHIMLFKELLKVWHSFFAFDCNNKENSYLIVPTNGSSIDMDIAKQFQGLAQCKEKPEMERSKMNFAPSDYLHKVICPWYRSDQDQRYIVTKVVEHLTPDSPFCATEQGTYRNYFYKKYGKNVMRQDQFLIRVKGITTHLNRLNPGMGIKGNSNKYQNLSEILIPELCHNFNYPGNLWLKATILPSTLHRLHYMLNADNLRENIDNYLNLSSSSGGNKYPAPLLVDSNKKYDTPELQTHHTITNKSIFIPDLKSQEIIKIDYHEKKSLTESLSWKEYEEPIDIDRHWDTIYPVDLDVYCKFLQREQKSVNQDFNIIENDKIPQLNVQHSRLLQNRGNFSGHALCDVSDDIKYKIKLLDHLNSEVTSVNQCGPQQRDVLAAITAASSSDVFDMERFEVLGDAFLKFSVSLFLIQQHKEWHEGYLTMCKSQIVSNVNLFYCGTDCGIPGLIKVLGFNPKNDWAPPLIKVPSKVVDCIKTANVTPHILYKLELRPEEIYSGNIDQDNLYSFVQTFLKADEDYGDSTMHNLLGSQMVSDKTVADCVEAILGVYVNSIGIERTFPLLQFFNILPKNANITNLLKAQRYNPRLYTNISNADVDEFLVNYKHFEHNLGYKFRDRAYLLQALTHPSYPTNRITGCYQQLEFLGDAILDFLVTSYIFERCKDMDPGKLTDLRSSLVNNVTLSCICVQYKFHLFILLQNAPLTEAINRFVSFQIKRNHDVSETVLLLSGENETNIAEHVDVPKILGDILEAIIGAVFLDSGNDLVATWHVIYNLMKHEIEEFIRNVPKEVVRRLYEYPGAGPKFSEPVVDDEKVMVAVTFTCRREIFEVYGFGQNKKDAKQAAAKAALQKLLQI